MANSASSNGVLDEVLRRLDTLPAGYSEGAYGARRYGVTLAASADNKRRRLFGEELGGRGRISCNLYVVGGRAVLKPCEMPAGKVVDFVLGFEAD